MSRIEFLRPSGAATWVVCYGYAAMRAAYPEAPDEADNEVREDGTACHWLASEIWEGRYPAEGSLSPNMRVIDTDMVDAVDMYHDVLRGWGVPHVEVEQPISCEVIAPNMSGTPDAWGYNKDQRTLYIADLKYGYSFVEVWENWQLIIYALAILHTYALNDLETWVEFTIVQPRSSHRDGPVRTWKCKASDLRSFLNILRHAAEAAMQPTPLCTPNPGCTDCAARHACVALQHASLRAVETAYKGIPLELEPAAIGTELTLLKDAAKKLEARITGLEVQSESLLRKGSFMPGWTLTTTYARERWREGSEADVLTLGKYFNADLHTPAKPISPARARKLIPANVVAIYAHKPSTGVRLTKTDPYEARKKFEH